MTRYRNSYIDIIKMIKGFFYFCRQLFSKDDIKVSLSTFSENLLNVTIGEPAKYELVITNNIQQDLSLKILVDYYLFENPTHPVGHHAYFEKTILANSHNNKNIIFTYDWLNGATFCMDGLETKPDTSWHGECRKAGKYFVNAVLLSEKGEMLEQLTLVQEVFQ